jgi:peroxiredoxin
MQLVQLQQNLGEIEGTGARVVGISCDPVEVLQGFSERSRIGCPLLSDAGSKIIDAYEIRNTAGTSREGVPFHATFIVDRAGIVRSKLYQVSYAMRPAVDNLVDALVEAGRANGAGSGAAR